MKSPWVGREALDLALAELAEYRKALDAQQRRYDSLLSQLHALKLAGAVEVPRLAASPAAIAKLPLREPDELKDLIAEKAGPDSRKRGMMLRALAADRANKVPDERIRQLIESGHESQGVPI